MPPAGRTKTTLRLPHGPHPSRFGFFQSPSGRTMVSMSRSSVRSLASFLTLACIAWSAACSSDDNRQSTTGDGDGDDAATGGAPENTGASPGTGSSDGSGGVSNGGAAGEGGAGGGTAEGPPEAPNCASNPQIVSGRNYGGATNANDYSVFAVRLSDDVPEGTYSIRVHDDDDGEAFLYLDDALVDSFDYDPTATLADFETQTLTFPGYFELDIRSQTMDDLSSLSASLFDGCHNVIISAPLPVQEGGAYGAYQIESLVLDESAEPGTYTFYAESGNEGSVVVQKDGEEFLTLQYDWMATVGGGESFTFVFDGLAELTVTRPMGMSNLFALADSLFDGRHELTVE